jgi:hypothetical protein
MKNFPKTTERFIAYFDIMGFKDLIYRSDHSAITELMNHVSKEVKNIKSWEVDLLKNRSKRKRQPEIMKGIVLPVLFSDSIIFISRSNTFFDAKKIVYASSFFLYNMFIAGVGVKGAIALGQFTADFSASKFYGRPLVDAYLLSEETHFYGAVFHHTFEKYLDESKLDIPDCMTKRQEVPMKGGFITHSFVDWSYLYEGKNDSVESVIEPFYKSVSGSNRRYVDNTKLVYSKKHQQS